MARSQRVRFSGVSDTYTVAGDNGVSITLAQEYLQFVLCSGRSLHTMRSYSCGLAEWWTVLEHAGDRWDNFPTSRFGDFLTYLSCGDLPGVTPIGPRVRRLAESSVQSRSAASGPGTTNRLPLLQIETRGSHDSVLLKVESPVERTP